MKVELRSISIGIEEMYEEYGKENLFGLINESCIQKY